MTILADRPAGPSRAAPRRRLPIGPVRTRLSSRPEDPAWVRPALLVLLGLTACTYLWSVSRSGWANPYYSAAVEAGSRSWKAFFFGSADPANFISVDKPPASLWVMDASVRIFGMNPWSILVPQALEGVAMVGVLFATVRRWFSPGAALLAGFVAASSPVAVVIFRFNNPDALLSLLLVCAAYCTVRAIERAGTGWLVMAAVAVGFGFLTKMMEAFVVVPALAGAYLMAAPTPLGRRLRQLAGSAVALVVASGWWVAAVQLTPAADRPYVGSTTDNNLVGLIFGYNGLGRLSGNEAGGGVTRSATDAWGPVGPGRLFSPQPGGQVSWLLIAALLFLVALLWHGRRAPRRDRTRAALVLFGTWLIGAGAVFSYARGIFHPYYLVALVPAIGALVGIGADACWRHRDELFFRVTLAVAVEATGAWALVLLARTVDPMTWLAYPVFAGSLLLALSIVAGRAVLRRVPLLVGTAGIALASASPVAYSLYTAARPEMGGNPLAGPPLLRVLPPVPFRPPGPALVRTLDAGAARYEFVAAVVGGDPAAMYQLSTGRAVMDIGGFHGALPVPTLSAFEHDVTAGRIHYFLLDRRAKKGAGPSSTAITAWVERRFPSRRIDGVEVYDLVTGTGAVTGTGP